MNLESWQAGLVLGAAFSLLLEWGVRFVLFRLRVKRGRPQCPHCTGVLGEDGRAEFPAERLECCAWCGDTWAEGARPEYLPPGYRDAARPPLPGLVESRRVEAACDLLAGLPPAPKKGDHVDLDAAFDRLLKPPAEPPSVVRPPRQAEE